MFIDRILGAMELKLEYALFNVEKLSRRNEDRLQDARFNLQNVKNVLRANGIKIKNLNPPPTITLGEDDSRFFRHLSQQQSSTKSQNLSSKVTMFKSPKMAQKAKLKKKKKLPATVSKSRYHAKGQKRPFQKGKNSDIISQYYAQSSYVKSPKKKGKKKGAKRRPIDPFEAKIQTEVKRRPQTMREKLLQSQRRRGVEQQLDNSLFSNKCNTLNYSNDQIDQVDPGFIADNYYVICVSLTQIWPIFPHSSRIFDYFYFNKKNSNLVILPITNCVWRF